MEGKGSDTSSAANSEEYEIVAASGTSPVKRQKSGESGAKLEDLDEATLKETMSECLNDEKSNEFDTSMVNENRDIVEDESNHTIFHNINYLGATRMDEPKNEKLIQGIIRQFNVLDDLQHDAGEEKSSINVMLAVPKSSEEQVVLRDAENLTVLTQFEICRIIFFARGNSGSAGTSKFIMNYLLLRLKTFDIWTQSSLFSVFFKNLTIFSYKVHKVILEIEILLINLLLSSLQVGNLKKTLHSF